MAEQLNLIGQLMGISNAVWQSWAACRHYRSSGGGRCRCAKLLAHWGLVKQLVTQKDKLECMQQTNLANLTPDTRKTWIWSQHQGGPHQDPSGSLLLHTSLRSSGFPDEDLTHDP